MMQRKPVESYRPVVLTVAGSDSGGGAGIQADIKAIEAGGCFAASAITAVTAQNTIGVQAVEVLEPNIIEDQITAVCDDLAVAAIKTGMLASESVIETVEAAISAVDAPLVIDPVMVAASGDRLLDRQAEAAYESLIDGATIVTPNADEATVLTGIDIETIDDAIEAGEMICDMGAEAALTKGGHWGDDRIEDVLITDDTVETITHDRVESAATHGSGCYLASSIAAGLARGDDLSSSVSTAIEDTARAIRYHLDIGQGPGSVHHLASLRTDAAAIETQTRAAALVQRLREGHIDRLVPEVGMNIGVALPHAEVPDEIAAIDGRLVKAGDDIVQAGPIRFGASGHVARYLLEVREHAPEYRVAANCRFDSDVEAAMIALDWPLLEVDREDQPDAVAQREGGTMPWVAETAYGGDDRPVAVFDRGAVGKEAMVRLVATNPSTLGDRLLDLADELAEP